MTDTAAIVRWGAVLLVLDLLAAGPAKRLLGRHGRAMGLPLVLLVWAYLYWLWGSLASLPLWGVGISGGLALGLLRGVSHAVPASEKAEDRSWAWRVPVLFWSVFLVALAVRAWAPSLNFAEKLPDLALFQGAILDPHFPPQDRWLAGFSANYYYFGQLLFAPIVRVSGVPPEWAFNLSVCTILAMAASGAYAFVRLVGGTRFWASTSVFSMVLASNWEWMAQLATGRKLEAFSWWDSSRAMPGTITEFPYFSFLLGDFHAHFIAIPWLTLGVFLVFALKRSLESPGRKSWILGFLAALAVGVHYPLNPWELPLVAGLTAFVLGRKWKATALVGISALLLFLPFWLTYERPVASAHWVPVDLRSPVIRFFLHWGLFVVPLALLTSVSAGKIGTNRKWFILTAAMAAAVVGGWVVACAVALVAILWASEEYRWDDPVFALLVGAAAAVAFCEMFHLDDLYGPALKRLNTVFKFYTMAWWALALAVPALLSRNRDRWGWAKKPLIVLFAFCVLSSLVYPVLGTNIRRERGPWIPTLDGMAFWQADLPDERPGVEWLRRNTAPDDVLWEASGPAYKLFGRFSAFSGRPAVLGWDNHEWVWRKGGFALTNERKQDEQKFLTSGARTDLDAFVRKYHVKYIVVGKLERETWPPAALSVLEELPKAFEISTLRILGTPY